MVVEQISQSVLEKVAPEQVHEFRAGLAGASLVNGDPGYDDSRAVRNALIDRHPGIIVTCKGIADVIAAVNFAREHDLLLSVRGGGHNVAGKAVNDGGIVIDLSEMRSVRVDPVSKTIRAEGGATWSDLDRNGQVFGLAAPGGVVSSTGIGGLTLHGGYGHLRRKAGLSIDNLLSLDVVTADGQLRHASATENPDLFWAMRGAGSNFGVVTSMQFQATEVGPLVYVAAVFYPLAEGPSAMSAWRDYCAAAPNDVSSISLYWTVPNAPVFPPELQGQPVYIVAGVFAGDPAQGESEMALLRSLGTPLLDMSGPLPWTVLQSMFDPFFPAGDKYYWKSMFIDDFSKDAVDAIYAAAETRPSPESDVMTWHLGGAMAAVDPAATPYFRRDAAFLVTAEASRWKPPATDDDAIGWARNTLASLAPYSQGGSYINFAGLGEDAEATLRGAFGPNYDRLVELKRRYDPDNLFRMNLNIAPA